MEPDDSQPRQDDAPQYPPIPEVASNFELNWRWRFAHGMLDWAMENRICARELAMLRVMNQITDKPDWETRIFDEEIAASWKAEAVARERLLSRKSWDWCLKELRYKAEGFAQTGRVAVYDSGPRIVKSRLDGSGLKALVQDFIDGTGHGDDWPLEQDGQVLNIIDPSVCPLAYGVTKVLPDGKEVDPDNLWERMNQGHLSAVAPDLLADIFSQYGQDPDRAPDILRGSCRDRQHPTWDSRWSEEMPWRYSTLFQWLPCDVKFADSDNDKDCTVRLDGYISNLHPSSHRRLYSAIEDAISASIQPWNDTVTYATPRSSTSVWSGLGRASPRIRSFTLAPTLPISPNGICWREEGNFYKDLLDLSDAWETLYPADREASLDSIITRMDSAENHCVPWCQDDLLREYRRDVLDQFPRRDRLRMNNRQHHPEIQARLEKFLHKEPGIYYTFEDWRAGKIPPKPVHPESRSQTDSAYRDDTEECEALRSRSRRDCDSIPKTIGAWDECRLKTDDPPPPGPVCPHCPCVPSNNEWLTFCSRKSPRMGEGYGTAWEYDHEYRHAELQSDFRLQGLQVYVRVQSVQLTPEHPRYEGGDWTLEGLLNERVVASSICFFDVENVAGGAASLSFRVAAEIYDEVVPTSFRESFQRLISMYAMDDVVDGKIPPLQVLGSVSVPEGRVVSFPSILQYRMGPVELRDASKLGHVRFLTLCLAEPNHRVVSTKRVVPQRFDWWEQDVFPWAFLMSKGLPDSVVRMIAEEARGVHIVTHNEAGGFRARMMLEKETMMAEVNSKYRNIDHPGIVLRDSIGEDDGLDAWEELIHGWMEEARNALGPMPEGGGWDD